VKLNVIDTGEGIPEKDRSTLFDPLAQIEKHSKRNKEGTGLGLVLCKYFAELMAGSIECRENVDGGTIFSLTFQLDIPYMDSITNLPVILGENVRKLTISTTESTATFISKKMSKYTTTVECVLRQAFPLYNISFQPRENASVETFEKVFLDINTDEDIETAAQIPGINDKEVIIFVHKDEQRIQLNKQLTNCKTLKYVMKPITIERIHKLPDTDNRDQAVDLEDFNPVSYLNEPLGNARILAVEDNALLRRVLAKFLDRLDYKVDICGDATKCLNYIDRESYDIVLIDIYLPKTNGHQIAADIRKIEKMKNAYLVALTPDTVNTDEETVYTSSGFNYVVNKPVDYSHLYQVLKNRPKFH
jgi:CheY-like chemotaxis protein